MSGLFSIGDYGATAAISSYFVFRPKDNGEAALVSEIADDPAELQQIVLSPFARMPEGLALRT